MFNCLRKTRSFGTLTVLICFKTCFHEKVAKTLHMEYIPLHLYWPSQSVIGFVGLNLFTIGFSRGHSQVYLGGSKVHVLGEGCSLFSALPFSFYGGRKT